MKIFVNQNSAKFTFRPYILPFATLYSPLICAVCTVARRLILPRVDKRSKTNVS